MRLWLLQLLTVSATIALLAALVHAPRPQLPQQAAASADCIQPAADRITAAACEELLQAAHHYGSTPP